MASKVGLDIYRFQISLASITGMASFHYNKKGILVANRDKKCDTVNKIWVTIVIIAVCYSCIEMYTTLKKMTTADVAKAAFQGFVLQFHTAELFTILGILDNKHNLPQLINCMQSFNLKYNDLNVEKKRGRRFLNLSLVAMAYNVVGMSIVVTLICFIFPCFHPFLVTSVWGNSCENDATTSEISFSCRVFVSMIQLLHFLPCTVTGGPAMIISLLSLDYIRSCLLTLRYICASRNQFRCNSEKQRLRRKHMYREIQILAFVCNDCCQNYYWLSIQFNGLVAVIVPFYSIIVFGDRLPLYFALVVLFFICFIAMFCLFVFEIGSQSAKLSQEILNAFKRSSKPSGWYVRFIRSCRPITMQVGHWWKQCQQPRQNNRHGNGNAPAANHLQHQNQGNSNRNNRTSDEETEGTSATAFIPFQNTKRSEWTSGSGPSQHITGRNDWFTKFAEFDHPRSKSLVDNSTVAKGMVGYDSRSNGYRLYESERHCKTIARNVTFEEEAVEYIPIHIQSEANGNNNVVPDDDSGGGTESTSENEGQDNESGEDENNESIEAVELGTSSSSASKQNLISVTI
ncbi:unnamed protein product [Orchesella dallaii]|uniref:Retroviral polymerase SH3-like domain-containing protein n=1 Tax=Orchesella dallaii TaxID=48710 RepID=A0ABP1RK01_9HEXA